ncbi:MAG: hypothetical protein QM767_19810 [Anaeromyxobacter sp.]
MRPTLPLVAAALLAAGCMPDLDPASEVTGLRVLAVRAEPPELAPGAAGAPDRATLGALVVHPAFTAAPDRRATVLHVACTPVPGDPSPSPCTQLTELADPVALLALVDPSQACAAPGTGAAGAITLAGLEACGALGCEPVVVLRDPADATSAVTLPAPGYALPAGYTLDLPAGNAQRVLGVQVVDLALALDAGPEALAPVEPAADACAALLAVAERFGAAWASSEHVTALKRITVRGPDAPSPPNRNPELTGVTLDGRALPLPGQAPASVAAGVEAGLLPVLPGDPDALREEYVRCDAAGRPIETRREDWTFSWFATAGELQHLHTYDATEADRYTAPGEGQVLVWAVVRDLRGGVAWRAAALEVAR